MCRFPKIDSIYLNMLNIHFLLVNMPIVGFKVKFKFYHNDLSCIRWHPLMTTKGFVFGVLHHKSKQCLFTIFVVWRQGFEIWLSAWKTYLCFHMFPCLVWRWCFHSNRWTPWFNWSTIKQKTHPNFQFGKCYQSICDICLQLQDVDLLHSKLLAYQD